MGSIRKIASRIKSSLGFHRGDKTSTIPLPPQSIHSDVTKLFGSIMTIPGWFKFDDCASFSMMLGLQQAINVRGDILEIGTYYGRSSSFLAAYLNPGESLVLCDLFESGDSETYGNCPTPEKVLSNILTVNPGLDIGSVRILKGNSSKLKFSAGARFRFIHIDGGHTYNECLADLNLCIGLLSEMGIMVIDDYQHPGWPEVTSAVDDFMDRRQELGVLADLNRSGALGRKLYLLKPGT